MKGVLKVFLIYFYSSLLEKRILLDFFGFCIGIFFMLRVLFSEVIDVVPFYVYE